MDARTGYAIHYDPLCEAGPVGAPWTGEPETVGGCDECFELVAEDLADNNEYQGRCFHCRREIKARGEVEWRKAVRRLCPHFGRAGW